MKIIETERLNLREITADDAAFILDLLNQPSFIRFIGDRNVRTVDEARAIIENRYRPSYEKFGFGFYTVELKTDNTPIGICGFVRRDNLPDADVGFAFLPAYEGKGYAFEAAQATMEYGKENLNLSRVLAIVDPDNVRSHRLLEKIGLKFDGMITMPGETKEIRLYSTDRAE